MKLSLKRIEFTDQSTIGALLIDDVRECWTLEDVVREQDGVPVEKWKIAGKTAIPKGRYRVIIDFSNRFQRQMPLLLNVPGFEGVRIHWGNTAVDTEGCPLLGLEKGPDKVTNSKAAFGKFFEKLEAAIDAGEQVWIEVS